ncbi:translin-like [Folsomia candida]|uniref:translin-like n=1 Tax=Folsomia candida TaxID=158441 RepID=UPI0016051417|nr:translin-like [Folsomia candida]
MAGSLSEAAKALVDEFKRNRLTELGLEVVESMASQFQTDLESRFLIPKWMFEMKVIWQSISELINFMKIQELRTVSRALEKATKRVLHILQRIHLEAESDEKIFYIGQKLPPSEYYKYADFFRFNVIKSVFAIGLSKFLLDGLFATVQFVASILQIPTAETRKSGGIFLEWEEYLEGMIDVGQELARLAKNCVILDNYGLVGKIHSYISTLTFGFSGMNFKNDGLRRRFDSLKYDSKAIEEVVYDLKMQKSAAKSNS